MLRHVAREYSLSELQCLNMPPPPPPPLPPRGAANVYAASFLTPHRLDVLPDGGHKHDMMRESIDGMHDLVLALCSHPMQDFHPVLGQAREARSYLPAVQGHAAKAHDLPCFNASTCLTHTNSHILLKQNRPFHPLQHIWLGLILCPVSPVKFPGGGVPRRLSAAT